MNHKQTFKPFLFGAELVKKLPHKEPFLFVDDVVAVGEGTQPALQALYRVRGDEPVLGGHFPGRPLWPGVYTIEGLAQACALLGLLLSEPKYKTWNIAPLPSGRGLLVRADIKLTRPVVPPVELIYEVYLAHVVGVFCRFEAEALIGHESVARGTITVAIEQSKEPQ
jgi:3-hydroxyacyl-[acyl-carrier-protein] dehydratase